MSDTEFRKLVREMRIAQYRAKNCTGLKAKAIYVEEARKLVAAVDGEIGLLPPEKGCNE